MTAAAKKKPTTKRAKVDRRPYAHAADMREAFLALHAALTELNEKQFYVVSTHPDRMDATHFSESRLMVMSWEMTEVAEKVREAAKRVLVARYGLRDARRWDGWRRPEPRAA